MTQGGAGARLSREDWEQAALDAIAVGGLHAVAVEPLAALLGVTKGSFYAHFASRRALIEAALERWERSHGMSLAELESISEPMLRLERVIPAAVLYSQSATSSVHVKLLGELGDPAVREALQRVDARRLQRLTESFRDAGFPAKHARQRAQLLYATYIGLLQMSAASSERLSRPAVKAMVGELRDTLLAPVKG